MESQEFFSDEFQPQKTEMLSRLSALTEIGRFYFPNVIKGDYFGHDKPSAYQGYRDICLEFLVYFFVLVTILYIPPMTGISTVTTIPMIAIIESVPRERLTISFFI